MQVETRGGWLTPWVLRHAAQVLCALFVLFWAMWFARFVGGAGEAGPPRVDFLAYWAAAEVTASGDADVAYRPDAFEAEQERLVGDEVDGFPWLYPPLGLLLMLPLALLPYGAAMGAWLLVTGTMLLTALKRITRDATMLWLAAAFPATLFNLIIGQAGLLSAGVFAWGMVLLPKRPVVAGAVLGLMAVKPHFLPLVLLALLAGRQKQALLSTIGSAGALSAVSLALFGFNTWELFVHEAANSTDMLYAQVFPVSKMYSVTALVLTLGGGATIAQAAQAVTSLAAAAGVFWLWRRDLPFEYKAAGLGLACVLASPYVYAHDLTVMGVGMVYFALRARESGWRRWERPALAVAWFLPLAGFILGAVASVSLGVIVLLGLSVVLLRRVRDESPAVSVEPSISVATAA